MTKILTLVLPLTFLAAFSLQANAQTQSQYCGQSKTGQELEATLFTTNSSSQSALFFDGKNIPTVSERCFISDRPGTRFIKCAHASGSVRVELYFKVVNPKGELQPGAVIWRGNNPESVRMGSCR